MDKIYRFIKNRDIFGHPIELTLNDKGDLVHRTLIGGFISLIIQITITYYVYMNVIKVVVKGTDDSVNSFSSFLELEKTGKIFHDDLHMT